MTVTAAQLPGCPDLTAVSLAFQVPPRADEREFANAVLRHADVRGVVIEPPPFDPGELVAQVRDRLHLPDLPNCHGAAQLRSAMNARGIRVCLTGGGGDIGLEGSDYYFADLLKQGKLTTFLRRYGEVVSSRTHAWRSTELLQYALWPVLPYPFRRALRPLARRVAGLGLPTWIDPALVRRAGLAEPPAMARPGAGTSIANETVARGYDDGLAHLVHDLYEVGSSRAGIYDRHPFLDRRLVEYILTLPDDQRWRKGRSKFVLRQAMGERLPAVVRHRSDRSKADFSHLLDLALEGIGGRLFFEHLSIERMGWVTPGELPRLYDRMRQLRRLHAAEYRDLTWQLWFAAAVELWHSRVFDNPIRRNPWTSATRAPEWRQMSNPAAPLANRIAARNSSSTGRLPS